MKTNSFFLATTAIAALCDLGVASARAALPKRNVRGLTIDGLGTFMEAPEGVMRNLRRSPATTTTTTPTTETAAEAADGLTNATITQACISTLANLTVISNEAGMAACYNVLSHDATTGTFEADLRLYEMQQPSGAFSDVAVSQMLVDLVYPSSTTFTLLKTKRKKRRSLLAARTTAAAAAAQSSSDISELQQYSLSGAFASTVDPTKLNQTELMSLMIPAINVVAAKPGSNPPTQVETNVTMTDIAFFVVGDFQDQFTPSIATTTFQAAAIAQSAQFKLPGTTLGIFPTGLIVTCAWIFFFLLAYGLGTVGRFQHRSMYRKRIKALRGRTGFRM